MYAIKTNPRFGRPVVGLATEKVATAALIERSKLRLRSEFSGGRPPEFKTWGFGGVEEAQ